MMQKTKRGIILMLLVFFTGSNIIFAQLKKVAYSPDTTDFANPERGFYIAMHGQAGGMDADELIKLRTVESIKSNNANYSTLISLVYKGYLLTAFKNDTISQQFLQLLQQDFDAVRKAGLKMVLRFSYTDKSAPGDCPDKQICPPYGDASKEMVLKHISQLTPLLRRNADVIAVVQQGFIGIWGENFYTDFFGDLSNNPAGYITDSNWNDRNEMLKALLDALPKSRMVQVRTPQIKQRYVNGPGSLITAAPMVEKESFTLSDKARIALHNDCFLSSIDDYGTFLDNGKSPNEKTPGNKILRKYFEADSRYVAVGGETCDDAFSPQNDCAPFGHADAEMAAMHYSFLNVSYNNLVNNDWESQGCMFSIKRKLGYRFILKKAVFQTKVNSKNLLKLSITLTNEGYASPYNPRPLQLVLRNTDDGKIKVIDLRSNVQKWFPGNVIVKETVTIPAGLKNGKYELLLNLPDGYASLKDRPEYSIRLANLQVWEPATGYNNLNYTIQVQR